MVVRPDDATDASRRHADREPSSGSMTGQTALITGGASGIGLATAELLFAQGAQIAIVDRDGDAARRAAESFEFRGGSARGFVADVGNETAVASTVRQVLHDFGSIDILINNAGKTAPAAPMWETPLSDFEDMWRVHMMGTVYFCRSVVPGMIERAYGRIVNVASVAGKEGNAGSSAYSSAKAGVIGLTKSLGKELAESGVLVNAVTPGIIRTPILDASTPDHIARLLAKIPMKRAGEANEVAELIAWLSSSKCSFSTAAVFDVSGGRTTY